MNWIIKETGMTKPIRETLTAEVSATGEVEPAGLATKEQYVMEMKIRYEFWCNKAQYKDAVKIARKAVLTELYAPVLNIAARLRKAAMDNDEQAVFELANDLERELGID